jgi:hypothetical protein
MAKVVTTDILIRLNQRACIKGYNRTLQGLEQLDPDGFHLVTWLMDQNDAQYLRCGVLLKVKDSDDPVEVTLDMSFEDYNRLMDAEEFRRLRSAGVKI